MSIPKWLIICFAVAFFMLPALIGVGCYQIGSSNGYQSGHTIGYSQGQHDGYKQGYDKGHQDGYNQGYNKGVSDGKAQNVNNGYSQGYTDGQTFVTNEWTTWERKWCVSVSVLNAPWQACYTPNTP